MQATDLGLDYFTFYECSHQTVKAKVELQCQFDEEPEPALVTGRRRFGDRSSKNGQPVVDPNSSLTWYDLTDPLLDPHRAVVFEDQFGKHEVVIRRLVALLTPVRCVSGGRSYPRDLDHFKVFEVVKSSGRLNVDADFASGFGSRTATLGEPAFFCAPANKIHDGKVTEIKNDKAHMVIYRVVPEPAEPQFEKMRDQFGRYRFDLTDNQYIGTPCAKSDWKVA